MNRRHFIGLSSAAGIGALASCVRPIGANEDVRIAIVGFNSHGKSHLKGYRRVKGVRIVALCDPDRDVLGWGVQDCASHDEKVEAYTDLRKLLERDDIDAISGATPNHWHCLSAIWACQAGKHACIEKPVSHNIFEGRKAVEAARRYGRLVQGDFDRRSDLSRKRAIEYVLAGNLGKILRVYCFVYKRRRSIGRITGSEKPPSSVDFDLWCGPSPLALTRQRFHYDWHWQWATGNGETGNNGPHVLDEARWSLGEKGLPKRVLSMGGRFGYEDDGNTPNTQLSILEYGKAPIIFEVRGLGRKPDDDVMDLNRTCTASGKPIAVGKGRPGANNNVIVVCENGYRIGSTIYDNDGEEVRSFTDRGPELRSYFPDAIRSGRHEDLNIDIEEGHVSTALCHMANISFRVGAESEPNEAREAMAKCPGAAEILDGFEAHLAANGVDLKKSPLVLGPWLDMDPEKERFVSGYGYEKANALLRREYREPFVIPEKV